MMMIGESMKLQKHLAYRYKNKEYYKHVIIVPQDTIDKLGWDTTKELEETVEGKSLRLSQPVQKDSRKLAQSNPNSKPVKSDRRGTRRIERFDL